SGRDASTRRTAPASSTRPTARTTRSTSPTRATSGGLAPLQGKREAGRPALALRELVGPVDDDLDAGRLEPPARLAVLLRDQRNSWREGERVAAERLELLVGHLDHLDPELAEELREANRQQRRV